MFPFVRMRRNRKAGWIRNLVAENSLQPSNLIYPMFVIEGENARQESTNMPGVFRLSKDLIVQEAKEVAKRGINSIIIFPCTEPSKKDEDGSEALNENNLICQTIKMIKDTGVDIGIIADVALDPYTIHGHDGIVRDGMVDNDLSLEHLANQAVTLCKAGADVIAPSDMMDGRIGVIREVLDDEGYEMVNILSYAVKYASNFYGPFRNVIGSAQNLKQANKSTYQLDYRNVKEAMREIELDIDEGADMVMVKPAMPYLDVISEASNRFEVPILGFQVSGEYAMIKHAALAGCWDFDKTMLESLYAIRRAGASSILTYAAMQIANQL